MNILILQSTSFPRDAANSFYWVYAQLTEWLTAQGYPSELYFCYLNVADREFENGLLLPDKTPAFYSPRNIEAICEYITQKKIDAIFDFSHLIIGDTRRFFIEIKQRNPKVLLLTMIHNCPSHTTQLKQYEISTLKLKEIRTPKQFIQWMVPGIYMYLLKKVVRKQNQSAYDTLDEVVLLSPAYLPEFRELIRNKDTENRLSAIPNAIRPVQSKVPFELKKKRIIFVGRIETEKAMPKLFKIWEMIQDKLPDWELVIVGDGSKKAECHRIIEKRELKRVRMEGWQMSIPYIDESSILCLTSVIEGFPSVFIEAMTLGVVPIGFDSFRAIHDMIENGEDGFIIPNDDYNKYAETIVRLATDDAMRRRIATKAQSKANRYDIAHIGPLWLKMFKKHDLI